MNIQVRIPVPIPSGTSTRSTADAAELSNTRDRAAVYAREQEAHSRCVVGAAGDQDAAALALIQQDERTRAMLAYSHTATREGVTKLVTHAAVGSAVTVGVHALLGPLGGVAAALGGMVGIKLLGGAR